MTAHCPIVFEFEFVSRFPYPFTSYSSSYRRACHNTGSKPGCPVGLLPSRFEHHFKFLKSLHHFLVYSSSLITQLLVHLPVYNMSRRETVTAISPPPPLSSLFRATLVRHGTQVQYFAHTKISGARRDQKPLGISYLKSAFGPLRRPHPGATTPVVAFLEKGQALVGFRASAFRIVFGRHGRNTGSFKFPYCNLIIR